VVALPTPLLIVGVLSQGTMPPQDSSAKEINGDTKNKNMNTEMIIFFILFG
jgi:hypothetical protein